MMKILLIDDEPFALKLLLRQLATLGKTEVQGFESARDALAEIERDAANIDLVFCDLQMPDIDGVQFVRHLAQMRYRGGLVLVSGEEERVVGTVAKLARAQGINVVASLRKPISPEQLWRVFERRLSARPAVSPSGGPTFGPDELRRALAGDELFNHYQPKIDLVTGAVVGVEALVRWQHPKAGVVMPAHFVSVAEKSGLIDSLTRNVLRSALAQCRRWRDAGLELQVAVNISMDNLKALDFPDYVSREMETAGVPSTSLVLEVTESRLNRDPLAMLDILTRLRLRRIVLSIDDFGTGHSSLAQLRDVPFEEMKLDRSFVHGAHRDPALRAIVEASLSMARQLGMKTVGEGVEDHDDWAFLRATGCDLAQGYFIARPMPAREIPPWCVGWPERCPELQGQPA